jgi:hypothetical protein
MPTPADPKLYEEAREYIFSKYKKNSAYRSGAVVKHYKQMFAKRHPNKEAYIDDNKPKNIKRWFEEKWIDVNPLLGKNYAKAYPLYRPTKMINKMTPALVSEIPQSELLKQYKLKQKYRGEHNLPTFKLYEEVFKPK